MLWTAPRRVDVYLWYSVFWRVALAATDCQPLSALIAMSVDPNDKTVQIQYATPGLPRWPARRILAAAFFLPTLLFCLICAFLGIGCLIDGFTTSLPDLPLLRRNGFLFTSLAVLCSWVLYRQFRAVAGAVSAPRPGQGNRMFKSSTV